MQEYLVATGSNMRHAHHGGPRQILIAAEEAVRKAGVHVLAAAPVMASRPIGPSRRIYANGGWHLAAPHDPPAMLALLQQIERDFARHRRGMRWQARTLDLDIVLWSGGVWSEAGAEPGLIIPHPEFAHRAFVTGPLSAIAPGWRVPGCCLTLRQLHARLTRSQPLPSGAGGGALSSVGRATDF